MAEEGSFDDMAKSANKEEETSRKFSMQIGQGSMPPFEVDFDYLLEWLGPVKTTLFFRKGKNFINTSKGRFFGMDAT